MHRFEACGGAHAHDTACEQVSCTCRDEAAVDATVTVNQNSIPTSPAPIAGKVSHCCAVNKYDRAAIAGGHGRQLPGMRQARFS